MFEKIKSFGWLPISILLFYVFLPFERLLTLEVFGLTLKISFVLLLILLLAYISNRKRHQLFTEDKLLIWFVVLSFATIIWSIDQQRSLIIATIFAATIIGFVALRRNISNQLVEKIKSIIIFSAGILALFALWQYFGDLYHLPATFLRERYTSVVFGFPRPQATFLEPLYFANYLLIPIFLTAEKLILAAKIDKKWYFLASNLILIMVAFVLALSRGAYIGFALAALVLLAIIVAKFRADMKSFWRAALVVIIGLILGVGLIYFTSSRQSFSLFVIHAGVADVSTGESTLDRFYFAHVAWQNFKLRPWGIGAGAFGALSDFSNILSTGQYQTVGNLYLEILVEEGAVGLLLFLGFLFLLLRDLYTRIRKGSFEAAIYSVIIIAILVQAVSFSSLYILPIWATFALAWPRTD